MTGPTPASDPAERDLLRRVLDALLREDHLGLADGAVAQPVPAGLPPAPGWWRARLRTGRVVLLPVRRGGFLADHVVADALLVADGQVHDTLDAVLAALAPTGDAEAQAGWVAFTAECADALLTARLPAPPPRPEGPGFRGLLELDARAALREHPVHPTGRARLGVSAAQQRAYAPEFRPVFPLAWTVVPAARMRVSPALAASGTPRWWPTAAQLGVPGDGLLAVPVHPLNRRHPVHGRGPDVVPTLSMRTVALADDPAVHLKLPLPTATLGVRNRRTVTPGTFADGATVHRLLAAVLRREPGLAARISLTDESHWLDSPDDTLAAMIRRHPPEIDGHRLVPLAALLTGEPGATVLHELADGDVPGWFDRYLHALLDWHVALWVRYGVALEAHQQNVTLAGPRLLYRDDDGARIDCARLGAALGHAVAPGLFHDRRIAVTDDGELADLVVTITLHLCVGALVVGVAGTDRALRSRLLGLARGHLLDAAARWCDPGLPGSADAAAAVRRVVDADRWPVKAMVTAGTLLPKARLGCADVNKHYRRTGPNYLLE